MSRKLVLIREEKLFRLLPGRSDKSRLEASGVALLDNNTALVIFDNLNQVARIDLSFKNRGSNLLFAAPSLGSGFEDIAIDLRQRRIFCLVESVQDFDGHHRSYVAEYKHDGQFIRCSQLQTRFQKANKGFEGLTHVWLRGHEFLYALYEGNVGNGKRSSGRVDAFRRMRDGNWEPSHRIRLPKRAAFEDYAALAYRDGQLAIVSQASARLWVARIDEKARAVVPNSEAVYRFPSNSYGNVEGIAWLSQDTLVAVSDRKKRGQRNRCAKKDQSIHLFRIPAE